MMALLYFFGYIMAWPMQLIFFKRKTYYEDKKDTSRHIKGGAIIVSNHRSLMDFMMMIFVFPFRKLWCLMSELIFSHGPFVSFFTKVMGGIKVDRKNYNFDFINKSLDMLKKKKLMIIYPEAKVATTKKMLPFHPSYILIALKSGAPIVPVYTDGRYGIKKRTRLVIGKKIYLRDYCNNLNPTKEELEQLNNMIKRKIQELSKICDANVNKERYPQGFRFKYWFRDLGRFLCFTMNVHFRVKIHNKGKRKKNLKIKGKGIIVCNHIAFTDPLALMCAYWRRRVYCLAAEVVFDGHPKRSFLLNQLGIVRIDRNKYDFDAFQKCIDIINAGNVLIIFPEGHIGQEGADNYKAGVALLAQTTGAPIYQVHITRKDNWKERIHLYLSPKQDINDITGGKMNQKSLDIISTTLYNNACKLKEDAQNGNIR